MASRRISEDLLVEILKRLPVKSLMRFKATSKGWCALIKSPNFIKSHLASAPDRVLIPDYEKYLLFPDDDDESLAVNLNINGRESVNLNTDGLEPVNFDPLSMSSTCDGILCLYNFYASGETRSIFPIILWNPATRKFKSLPTSSYIASTDKIGAIWQVGFGFDSKTDDYKVVATLGIMQNLWQEGETFMNYAEVYSLKTNSWRVIDVAPRFFNSYATATYSQGLFHWMTALVDLPDVDVIVSFDMEDEVFRVTPGPPPYKGTDGMDHCIMLASSNESVVAIYSSDFGPIEVWAMKDLFAVDVEGDCWTLEYILEPPADGPPVYDLALQPLGLWKNCLLFIQRDTSCPPYLEECVKEISLYNPGTREIRNLRFPGRIFPSGLLTYSYKETLVSLA